MMMKHVLLEMYCTLEDNQNKPIYCMGIGHNCIHNNCEYMAYTYCPNEIAYAGEYGVVESFDNCIGYGGEMEGNEDDLEESRILLDKWGDICRSKIDEAYDEYMKFKQSKL